MPEKITPAVIYTVQIVMSGSGISAAAAAAIRQIFTFFTFRVPPKHVAGRYLPEALIDWAFHAFIQRMLRELQAFLLQKGSGNHKAGQHSAIG